MDFPPHFYSTIGRSSSSFSGFFIDFQRTEEDSTSSDSIKLLGEEVYKVPIFCDNPVALENFCNRIEDQHFPERTYEWLTSYEPSSEGMRKAKNFWLKTHKYNNNPHAREEIKRTYRQEVIELGHLIWKKHCQVDSECMISAEYYKTLHLDEPVPEEFDSLHYYHHLEPSDTIPYAISSCVSVILDAYKPSSVWTLDSDDLNLIQTHLPHKIESLKKVLWHRHLGLESNREESRLEQERATQEIFRKIKIGLAIAGAILAPTCILSFATVAFILAQPLFFIPSAAIFAVAAITTKVYFSRSPDAN